MMSLEDKAILVAQRVHADQTYEIFPYIYHVLSVRDLAKKLGYDEIIVVASILHDVLEDSFLSYSVLKRHFGLEIAEICFALWDEKGRNRKEKHEKTYPAIRESWKATVVKVLDRVVNKKTSEEFNPSKAKMYRKEHSFFVESLTNSKHPKDVNKAWDLLEEIMKEANAS